MGDAGIHLHHIKNTYGKYVENILFKNSRQHKAAHVLRGDLHNIEMANSILGKNELYYKLGYTDAVNNKTNNIKLNKEQEEIYMDGFIVGIGDLKNNSVDNNEILSKTYLRLIMQLQNIV